MSRTLFISLEEVLAIHDLMLNIGGGRSGINDFTLLHSAVERPKATFAGKELYPTIWTKAAALLQSLVKNHPFSDGNKRTAFYSTLRFLNTNTQDLIVKKEEIIHFMVSVDTQRLNIESIAQWLEEHSTTAKK